MMTDDAHNTPPLTGGAGCACPVCAGTTPARRSLIWAETAAESAIWWGAEGADTLERHPTPEGADAALGCQRTEGARWTEAAGHLLAALLARPDCGDCGRPMEPFGRDSICRACRTVTVDL